MAVSEDWGGGRFEGMWENVEAAIVTMLFV